MQPGEPQSVDELIAEQRKQEQGWWLGCVLIALPTTIAFAVFMIWYVQNVMGTCKVLYYP
ncbi:MAG TPA: hypothetical protein VGN15_06745 [Ktedonobacteraceae bacterium]|nr:hypothetical protein [Ktedonobacteraceae bacterium]